MKELQRAGVAALWILVTACSPDDPGLLNRLLDREPKPDSLPAMLNTEPPFKYPTELYSQRIQGNVSLRLFIDSTGLVLPESTKVHESSGNALLDSAATAGSRELKFSPARRHKRAMAVSIVYPVFFRHPEGPPVPGDSVLRKGRGGGDD